MTTDTPSQPDQRDLPAGYDNPGSPLYVKPEVRQLYRSIVVPEHAAQEALTARQAEVDHAFAVRLWERVRDQRISRGDRSWLRENTRNGDGLNPTRRSLSDWVEDDQVRDMFAVDSNGRQAPRSRNPLTSEQIAETMHRLVIESVRRSIVADISAIDQAKRVRADRTCAICGVESRETAAVDLVGQHLRACPECVALAPLVAAAATPVTDGRMRLRAVADFLDTTTPQRRLTEEEVDAWLDHEGAPSPAATLATPANDPGRPSTWSRLLGRSRAGQQPSPTTSTT